MSLMIILPKANGGVEVDLEDNDRISLTINFDDRPEFRIHEVSPEMATAIRDKLTVALAAWQKRVADRCTEVVDADYTIEK